MAAMVTRPRLVSALCALVLLAAACGPATDGDASPEQALEDLREVVGEAADDLAEQLADEPTPTPGEPGEEGAPAGTAAEPPGDPDGGAQADPPAQPAPGAQDEEPEAAERPAGLPDDRAGIGAMCRPYLRGDVPRLVVEIDAQPGAAPARAAVDHLASVLGDVLDKPGGVRVAHEEIPGRARTWTRDEVRELAQQHRDRSSSGDELVMYVLALRGQFERTEVLGLSFSATEFAIFPDTIGTVSTLLGGRAAVERAVLVHEAGHLLCLVNLTYRSDIDHEDPEHPHHSGDRASVMHWSIETDAIAQFFTGPPPADFTDNDRADLDGLRDGRH